MPGSHLSYQTQRTIRDLHKQGKSIRSIAKKIKCNQVTVYRCINRECIDPIHKAKVGVGRKRKLSEYEEQQLTTILTKHSKLGSRRLAPMVNKRLRANRYR
jgi:transposase